MTSQDTSSEAYWLRIAEAFAAKESSTAEDVIKLVTELRRTTSAASNAAQETVASAAEAADLHVLAPKTISSKRAEQIHADATEIAPDPPKKAGRPRRSASSVLASPAAEPQKTAPAPAEQAAPAGEGEFSHITKAEDEGKEPAVPLDQAFTDELLVCLECGRAMKMLKRHLGSAHGMTPEEYKFRWDLPEDFPITAPNYSASKSEYAKDMGFGLTGSKAAPKKRGRKKASAK